ncbi:hypothetical protein O6H91_05G047400 [Diphasiastrum complanatum]|uniref:Uncharacterized protein n=1 Tax=Diphasiastrum complanatum TaxID=34168 RepID=A0ACC2DMY2_DIPCM|nr:hypothetical protein O6H91_Y064600 [Diphasiastrum complanatum]KAJ7555631.1 hypothetical protein O6H91_05G047400 [Diphasiastrum complanatum]
MGSLIMENQESIYNLVPPGPVVVSEKIPIPKAKYDRSADPFMTHVAEERPAATFGYRLGSLKPQTSMYLRKHSKEPFHKSGSCFCHKAKEKPPIPHEKPKMGVNSGKNYINDNAVEVIHATPKKLPKFVPRYVEKEEYGKVPAYLVRFNEILRKKQQKVIGLAQKQQMLSDHPNSRRLEEGERQELIAMLKQKWQQVNEAYQKISFTLDTPAKKSRKEEYEEQLMQIERDILTLSRRVVLVVDKGKSQSSSSHSDRYKRQLASHF